MRSASEPERIAPDVVRIPVDIPFPLPPVNATFVDGEVPTLFDTGCRVPMSWDSLWSRAAAADVDLARVKRVVLTHNHLDHAGNARRFRDELGVEVWIHQEEADTLERWDQVQPSRNHSYDAGLRRAGLPEKLLEKLARTGRDVDRFMAACPVDRCLVEGDAVDCGGRAFRVLHTPGHTGGSAIYHDEAGRLSVTGDTVLERITPNALSVRREEEGALARYLETLQRLREADLGTMIPGHGRVFSDLRATIDRAFRLYHERRQRIVGALRAAEGPMSTWNLVEAEWPEGQKGAAFLMTSEIQGHLDILVRDGLAVVTEPDDPQRAALYLPNVSR